MKPALPSHMARGVEVRTKYAHRHASVTQSEIRSSPVYAGRTIKPLKKLYVSPRAPAVSDRIEAIRQAGRPLPTSLSRKRSAFPSFRVIPNGVSSKGMISYRIGFSECAHKRASNGQHVRNGVFSESFPACQALFRRNARPRDFRQIGPKSTLQAP